MKRNRNPTDDDLPGDVETELTQVAQRHYDPDSTDDLTTAVVYAIAEAEGVSPDEVKSPPLYEIVDVSAMEAAFFGPSIADAPRQGVGSIEFRYTNYLVKVNSDGWIQVYEANDSGAS